MEATPEERLTCYVRERDGAVFAVRYPWLVELAFGVRHCTRDEGGPTAPAELPACV